MLSTRRAEMVDSKMKVLLLFLGLFFKVPVAESSQNSTLVYMVELEFEASVETNVTDFMNSLTKINHNNATTSDFTSTTECSVTENQRICSCEQNYTWDKDISKQYKCINDVCKLPLNETAVCLFKNKVNINGSSKVSEDDCGILCYPSRKNEDSYKKKDDIFTKQLMEKFSQMQYFDSLTVYGYRSGSIIADYTVQYLGTVTLNDLTTVVSLLPNSTVVTTGLVGININNPGPIDIGSSVIITCTPPPNLKDPKWFLTDVKNKTTQITSGVEATVDNGTGKVTLNKISGSWKGSIKCVYMDKNIEHTASIKLDIALLPEIQATSTPQFPDCRNSANPPEPVKIECKFQNNLESYNVTWDWQSTTLLSLVEYNQENNGNFTSYKADAYIDCVKKVSSVFVTCKFENTRATVNKYANQTVEIPIIYATSLVCNEESSGSKTPWPLTKSEYSAVLPCDNGAVGQRRRACNNTSKTTADWQQEISTCVILNLITIQKDLQDLNKGIGFIKDNALELMSGMKDSTTKMTFSSFANINASVNIYEVMHSVSTRQNNKWNDTVIPTFINSASNILNNTKDWKAPQNESNLPIQYLEIMEAMIKSSNMANTSTVNQFDNVKLLYCSSSSTDCKTNINASVKTDGGDVAVLGFRNLHEILPKYQNITLETTILSVTSVNASNISTPVTLIFKYSEERLPNHEMFCVFLDTKKKEWSTEGCKWGGATNPNVCECDHNSAFTILMSKTEKTLPYMEELTYAGLGISIVSLITCIIIEILVWDTVVKSAVSNFRHVAILNISLSLLFADIGFLATAKPEETKQWCSILTVVKHYFFLATFFWMLCLSIVILHQMIYVFNHLRKKVFWGVSITVGYVCPLLCVAVTIITFGNAAQDKYYSPKTCWLIYESQFKGSIFGFIIPVGIIVFINLFTLAVVIVKILTPTVSEAKARDEKAVTKSMIKTIVFLSPVLGITWIIGFFMLDIDLTQRPLAEIVNYSFTILNSLQGFFILLTVCVGEKKIRDALRKRFKGKQSVHSKNESSNKMTSSVKK